MNLKDLSFLTLLLAVKHAVRGSTADRSIAALLQPLQELQIIIRLPEVDYYAPTTQSETLLQLMLINLIDSRTPIQLSLNFDISPTFHPGRHVRNTVAWLVLAANYSEANQIELQRIVNNCFWWPDGFHHFSLSRDLVHLVGVQKSSSPQRYVIDGRIRRCQSPFYLVILFWFPPDNISLGRTWAFDTHFSVPSIRIVRLPSFFSLVKQGIQAVERAVSKARQDFFGERIEIIPSCEAFSRWEAWNALLAVPIRRIRGEQLMAFYTGYVLETLGRQHNFTWDTIPSSAKTEWRCQEGVISMRIMMLCRTEDCPLHVISSFSELTEIRTLSSSDLLPSGP